MKPVTKFTEKWTPHTRLHIVKDLVKAGKVAARKDAQTDAVDTLDFTPPPLPEMVAVVMALSTSDFYKSMTAYNDHSVWLDVYKTEYKGQMVYLKFEVTELETFEIVDGKPTSKVIKDRVVIASFKRSN